MRINSLQVLPFLLILVSSLATANELPNVLNPVVNATPPGAKVTAGYFTLENTTSEAITITGAYSPSITKVEIHLSTIENDVAKMIKQDSVVVPAGENLEFKHGGYHLMLMELTESLKPEQMVDIVLVTSKGDLMLEMPVMKMNMMKHGDMKHDKHKDKNMNHDKHEENKMKHDKHEDKKMEHGDMKHDSSENGKMEHGKTDEDKQSN